MVILKLDLMKALRRHCPQPPADVLTEEVRADVAEEPDDPLQEPVAPIPVIAPDHVNREGLTIDGVVLAPESSAQALRQACRNLGVGASGSRQVLYKRLKNKVARRELEDHN